MIHKSRARLRNPTRWHGSPVPRWLRENRMVPIWKVEEKGSDVNLSVHEKMRALGMEPVPAVSSLARIFRDAGVARLEPRKKPRASYRRCVYPAPNACWQLDGTECVLTGGRK